MKSSMIKLLVGISILATFGLKASCPSLPQYTTITIVDFPSGYYSVMASIHGYEPPTYTEYTDWDFSNTGASFSADHKFAHTQNTWVTVGIYVKKYWNSPYYEAVGAVASWQSGVTRTMDGDWLVNLSFNASMLSIPEED